jgi:hypothetical protein
MVLYTLNVGRKTACNESEEKESMLVNVTAKNANNSGIALQVLVGLVLVVRVYAVTP